MPVRTALTDAAFRIDDAPTRRELDARFDDFDVPNEALT
jgi:hypothetical protein